MDVKEKILKVTGIFGMKDDIVSKAMNIAVGTVRKNKSDKVNTHNFNEKNYKDLIAYIKCESDKL